MTAQNPVPIEELLAHRDWVRALARSLVLDANAADDLEQETWARALDRPPTDARSLRGWFARVVRHVLIDRRRADQSRALRELAAARPEATPDDDVVARMDAVRRVVQAAYELAEPYRTTLLLRYFEGLSVRDIAKRLDAPQDTVKTRLRRALEQLREQFDADAGGDGRAWCAALLPLAGANSALVKGGLVVTAKAKTSLAVAAVLLLALSVSVAVVQNSKTTTTPSSAASSVETASADKAHRRDKSADAAKPAADVLAPTPRGTGSVVGAVRIADGNKPAIGQKVTISTTGAASLDATTDERGAFRFEKLAELRAWRVRVEAAPELAPVVVADVRLERDETRDVGVLWLATPTRLEVVVKSWNEKPIAGATVEVFADLSLGSSGDQWTNAAVQRDVPQPTASAVADASGRAVVASIAGGDWAVVARAPGFVPAAQQHFAVARGETKRELVMRLDRGVRVAGVVLSRDRTPAPGLLVWAGEGNVFTATAAIPRTTTDAEGRFAFDAVRPGDVRLLVGPAGSPPAQAANLRVPTLVPIEIVLDGAVLEGRVTSAEDGAPLAGARVRVTVNAKARGDRSSLLEAVAGEDGRYRLDVPSAGNVGMFLVEHAGFVPFGENPWATGAGFYFADGRATRDFSLRRGVAVSGRVTTPDGPAVGARVVANWDTGIGAIAKVQAFADADGRFALTGVAPGAVVVQAFAEGWFQTGLADNWIGDLMWHRKPAGSLDVTEKGASDVAVALAAGRAISGRVESATGAPVADAAVRSGWTTTTTAADGTFRVFGGSTIGKTWVWASKGAMTSESRELAGDGAVENVVLKLRPALHFTGRATCPGGVAEEASVQVVFLPAKPLYGQIEVVQARVPLVDGRFDADVAQLTVEGKYRVRATASGFAPADSADVVVEPGRATCEVDVALAAPSRALAGRVVSAADENVGVAGARISLLPASWKPKPNDFDPRPVAAVADQDGRFRVPDVAESEVTLDLASDGFVHDDVAVRVAADGLVVKMTPAKEVAGVVRLPGGAPFAHCNVSARRENDQRIDNFESTQADADGHFRLAGLRDGTYVVSVSQKWQGTESLRPWERTGVAAGTKDLVVEMETAGQIAGRLVDVDGKPVAGCSVQAFSETGDRYTPSDVSKADGSFVVRGLGPGAYSLIAHPPQAPRQNNMTLGARFLGTKVEHLAPGASEVVIRLPDGAAIRGVLVDAAGTPMPAAWVRADYLPGQPVDIWTNNMSGGVGAQTDAAGAFALTGLLPGRYRIVHVYDPVIYAGGRPLRGGEDVASGASNLRLAAGGAATISGTVVDEDGAPPTEVYVSATPVGGGPAVSARADATGAFVLKDVSDLVRYSVAARKSGLAPGVADDVAPGTTGLLLRITRGLEASGRVLQKDGTPFKGSVSLFLEGGDYRVSTQTDADGRFTAKALREGVYRVEENVSIRRYGESGVGRKCGTIKAGEKDVELRMTE